MATVRGIPISPEKFIALRDSLGLTQVELAVRVGIAVSTIGRLESPNGARMDRRTFREMAGKLGFTEDALRLRIVANGHVAKSDANDVDKLARKWSRTLSNFTMQTPRDVQRRALAVWKDLDADQIGKLVELLASERAPAPAFDPDRPLRSTVIDAKGNAKTEVEKMKPARRRARAG